MVSPKKQQFANFNCHVQRSACQVCPSHKKKKQKNNQIRKSKRDSRWTLSLYQQASTWEELLEGNFPKIWQRIRWASQLWLQHIFPFIFFPPPVSLSFIICMENEFMQQSALFVPTTFHSNHDGERRRWKEGETELLPSHAPRIWKMFFSSFCSFCRPPLHSV